MKVEYSGTIRTISARIGKFVHFKREPGNRAFIRRFVKPAEGVQNHHFASVTKNSAKIWSKCSTGFRNDLNSYAGYLSGYCSPPDIPAMTNFAHFLRFLHRFREKHPEIDLAATTKEELETAGIPIKVKDIIEQGYLPPVPEADELTSDW